MIDLLTYLMSDCPAVAAVDAQAALAHMREKLAKQPPAALIYLPDGPAVTFTSGERVLLYAKETAPRAPRQVVSLTEPPQGRNPEKSGTTARAPVIAVLRPAGQ